MKKLKLNKFAENRLAEKEMMRINGGDKVIYGRWTDKGTFVVDCICECPAASVSSTGSSSHQKNVSAPEEGKPNT